MSSQFSYELDERQIRILMQNAEVSYSETAWQRFESLGTSSVSSSSKVVKFIPNINLHFSVSRSVVVPIVFIALIGSLSVLLFSFVDFKKKEDVAVEKPLIGDPNAALKPEPKTETKTVATKPKTETVKPTVNPNTAALNQVNNNTAPATTPPTTEAKKEPEKTIETKAAIVAAPDTNAKKTQEVKATESKPKETLVSSSTEQKKAAPPVKKKRKRKMVSDELPSINTTPATLSTQSSEPELDLK